MIETKNAKISSTMLGIEDHGIFSFYIYLDYGGAGQGAGGYCLDRPIKDDDNKFIKREATAMAGKIIMKILDIVGVEKWEDLLGKYIRVKAEYDKVHEIGNLLEDKWLNFEKFFKEANND
jgi:hypothetical protein